MLRLDQDIHLPTKSLIHMFGSPHLILSIGLYLLKTGSLPTQEDIDTIQFRDGLERVPTETGKPGNEGSH